MVSQRGGRVPRHKATGEPEGQIEGWFKTAKHRFGLHRFGQGTLQGMYRWLILSLTAYLIAHWTYLLTQFPNLPDWGEAARTDKRIFFPSNSSVSSFTRY